MTDNATLYRVQYPSDDGWTLTTTVDFPTLAELLGSKADALCLIFRGPGSMMWDLKLLACDTYGDTEPLVPTTTTEGPTMPEHDPFTIQHCAAWCDAVGIGAEWIPALVQALADDGPDSTMSWPSVARYVGATYSDGVGYR